MSKKPTKLTFKHEISIIHYYRKYDIKVSLYSEENHN